MKVSGFTLVKNAVKLSFPVVEAIRSVLPIVDEFVVAVGESDDGTEELIRGIGDPKIFIVPSRWNPNVTSGGFVLAQQTNVALLNCTGEWAIYLQSDELIHEDDHAHLVHLMDKHRADRRVDSLALHRFNFHGDYRTHYTPVDDLCVRVVKPHHFVLSRGDAAGFTVHPKYKERGRRIRAIDSGLPLFHYANIRTPEQRRAKQQSILDYWQGDENSEAPPSPDDFYYNAPRRFMFSYDGPHPAPMGERIATHDFVLDHASPLLRKDLSATERKWLAKACLARRFGGPFRQGAASCRVVGIDRPDHVPPLMAGWK